MKKNIKTAALLLSLVMAGSSIPCIYAAESNADNALKVGDINGDGAVNAKDLVRLMKVIADPEADIEAYGTDLNADGKVNAKDLVRLMKIIANPDDYTDTSDSSSSDTSGDDTEPPVPPETLGETENPNEEYTPIESIPAAEDISDQFDLSKGLVLVNANKKTEYKIVCVGAANRVPSNNDSISISDFAQATHEYEVAVAIQDTIKDMTGCTIPIVNNTARTSDKEIVIGSTSRDELFTDLDFNSFQGDSFTVRAYGNTILLAANPNPRTTENPYQDYDLADGIWKACEYFVKEYLHYDPATTLTTPVAKNGISVDIKNYDYTDPYTAPDLKENAAEDIDGFTISGYGDVGYTDLMTHNAYVRKGIDSPCYSTLTAANKKTLLNKAKTKGYLVYNTIQDACTCDECKAAAEAEGTEMGAYFKLVREIAAQMDGQILRILAANETYIPPKTHLGDNVEVLIYNPKLCSAHAINDPACEINAAFAANVEAWKKVCGHVSVLDFTSDYYFYPVTFPNLYTMKKNVEWYKSQNLYAVYLQFDVDQSNLEFSDLRSYLARVILENPNMSDDVYSEFINSGIAHYYGADKVSLIRTYIDRFDEEAHEDGACFNIYSEPAEILPMKVVVDGVVSYDTAFAKEAYALWEQIHPYNERLARNEAYLARMLSSRYQSEAVSHAKTQYQEWLNAVIDMSDKAWVLNRITNSYPVTE